MIETLHTATKRPQQHAQANRLRCRHRAEKRNKGSRAPALAPQQTRNHGFKKISGSQLGAGPNRSAAKGSWKSPGFSRLHCLWGRMLRHWTNFHGQRCQVVSEVGRERDLQPKQAWKERGGAGRIDNLLMLYVSRDRLDVWSRYLPIL